MPLCLFLSDYTLILSFMVLLVAVLCNFNASIYTVSPNYPGFFICKFTYSLKFICGLPWWLSGKEFACRCRRHRFDHWSRKIPHAGEQQSLCTTAVDPVIWSPGAATTKPMYCNSWSPCSVTRQAATMRSSCIVMKSSLHSWQLENARAATETQHSQKFNK